MMGKIAIFTNTGDKVVPLTITALSSLRRFHNENFEYFCAVNQETTNPENIELLKKHNITPLFSDYNKAFKANWLPTTLYLRFLLPEILYEKGFLYSLYVDSDIFCANPLDFDYLIKNTKAYSGVRTFHESVLDYALYSKVDPQFFIDTFHINPADIKKSNTNSGILFWNNKYCFDNQFPKKILEVYQKGGSKLAFGDQALLALTTIIPPTIPFNILPFSYNYIMNFSSLALRRSLKNDKVKIYHFCDMRLWENPKHFFAILIRLTFGRSYFKKGQPFWGIYTSFKWLWLVKKHNHFASQIFKRKMHLTK